MEYLYEVFLHKTLSYCLVFVVFYMVVRKTVS
jgi:hypothetical protein